MLRFFFILSLSLIAWHSAVQAEEPRKSYKVTRGQQFAVCRELAEILNQPENAGMQDGDARVAGEYVIPERYKNFKMAKWEPVLADELQKYVYKDDTKQGFEKLKKRYAKSWDGKGDYTFEKTLVNIDNFGPEQAKEFLKETIASAGNSTQNKRMIVEAKANAEATKENKIVLRYRFSNWKQWNCQLPDDVPEGYAELFNMATIKGYGALTLRSEACQIFLYNGQIFHTAKSYSNIGVYEPKAYAGYALGKGRLFDRNICSINKGL